MDKVTLKKELLAQAKAKLERDTGIEVSMNQAIMVACQAYVSQLKLGAKDLERIHAAATSAKKSPAQVLSAACAWAERFYGSRYKQQEKEIFGAGTAYKRIDAFVRKVIAKNDKAKQIQKKVFINQTFLMKKQGSNREAIKGYLQVNHEMLKKHHEKHRLQASHNIELARKALNESAQ